MTDSNPQQPEPIELPARLTFGSLFVRLLVVIACLAIILFLPAGRLDWPQAWGFIIAYSLFLIFYGMWGVRNDPGQLAERSKMAKNAKSWDKVILTVYTVLLLVMLVLAGLDAGRFRWSSIPIIGQVAGWIGLVFAGIIIGWTVSVNTFLSRIVRIQEERSHQVIRHGPYRWVRHPMYLGIIIMMVCIPVVLGSGWALIPGGLIGVVYVIRTGLEDRTLHEELPGYREYATQVRYRLLPGVW